MATISVIIPVYNVKDYLERCVESVMKQSYENLEIILVDDGSTDGSAELCDRLKNEDKRICVIHQENRGLSGARNTGISHARGEYIGFVDSDDWIDVNFYEELYSVLKERNVDIVSCKYRFARSETKGRGQKNDLIRYELLEQEDTMIRFLKGIISGKNNDASSCIKLYKKKIFLEHRFIEGMLFEDVLFNWEVINSGYQCLFAEFYGYNYFVRENSITQSAFSDKVFDLEKGAEMIMKMYKGEDLRVKELLEQYRLKSKFSILIKMLKSMVKDEGLVEKYICDVKDNFHRMISSCMSLEKKIVLCGIYITSTSTILKMHKVKNQFIQRER